MSSTFLDYAINLPIGARRVLFSHCPSCERPHDTEPRHIGAWIDPDSMTRSIVYGLCAPCGCHMAKAGKKGRKRITARIEKYLEASGVLEDLRKEGLRA